MSTWIGEMTDTITVAPSTGVAGSGSTKPTYGTQSTVQCFYVDGANVVRDADGELVDITATFYTQTEINEGDAIWVSGTDTNDDGDARTPKAVTHHHDLSGGDDVWEVEL